MKKGYKAEYEVKKILLKKYSPKSVFKIAIGGSSDFLVLGKNKKILKIVEVKKTNKKKWYPTDREFKQFKNLKAIKTRFKIPVEYWIKANGKWQVVEIANVKKFFRWNVA